ncbi:replication factor C small subunit [Halobaculum sp. CBA1158]|uniref:replication factor C small subunit n=1 Tax=Halobaculum sp. CBA1158 TaxID=2904243 RepID=UPI002103F0A8|nr:replication factor C small subunit [Halobaculum sp. CBA1158]
MFSGPAGVGKCTTGETPILTNRGVERIDRVVGDIEGFGTPEEGTEVVTFDDDGEFEHVEPSQVFGKEADELVSVTTRDGGEFTVTPEHKLLVIDADGLSWTPAGEIDVGQRVVRPLEIPTPTDPKLEWIDAVDDDRIEIELTGRAIEEFDRPVVSPSDLRTDDTSREQLREDVERITYVSASGNRSRPITPPWEVTPELARFVGLAVAEARIERGRVKFYNTDADLLDAFDAAIESCFGLSGTRGEQKGVPYVEVISRTLTHYLEEMFDVFASAGGADPNAVGSALVAADDTARAAFLRAMFDAEAHVADNGVVELTQRNERHITLLSYLLSSFGVPSRRKRVRKSATNGSGTEREYHQLSISGASALSRFEERIGFDIEEKAAALARATDRRSNPNHDTMPAQSTVHDLTESLCLPIGELTSDSLHPENPGRERYLDDVEAVLDAAVERVETAQTVLARLDTLSPALNDASAVPAAWVDARLDLEPLSKRKRVSEEIGVRTDRLLEYADGRRTPNARRTMGILSQLEGTRRSVDIGAIQRVLCDCIDSLGISYNEVAEGTTLRGTETIALLSNDDHAPSSLPRFETVADRVRTLASRMCSLEVIEDIASLDRLASADLYFDEVESVERADGPERVYDLTVSETRNYLAGNVPTVMHNTTSAVAIARTIYGDDWRTNFLELNASDQRGIDVVRDRIKNFARSSFGGHDYRIIFLDEADSLTDDAQSALRRTMEQFSDNTRFILSCNYSSKIIDPIQSRCAVFRFSPLSDEAVEAQVRDIAADQDIEITDEGLDALVYAADGDMRRAINSLQAAATTGDVVDEETVYEITATARPEEIEAMVEDALAGDFSKSRATLDTLLTETGMAGGDVIDQLHRSVWEFDLSDREAVRLMERIGETDYRISEGANEQVQLEALLASLALADE